MVRIEERDADVISGGEFDGRGGVEGDGLEQRGEVLVWLMDWLFCEAGKMGPAGGESCESQEDLRRNGT